MLKRAAHARPPAHFLMLLHVVEGWHPPLSEFSDGFSDFHMSVIAHSPFSERLLHLSTLEKFIFSSLSRSSLLFQGYFFILVDEVR